MAENQTDPKPEDEEEKGPDQENENQTPAPEGVAPEQSAPVEQTQDEPAIEQPAAETPDETPVVETPETETPVAETPEVETPEVDTPVSEAPETVAPEGNAQPAAQDEEPELEALSTDPLMGDTPENEAPQNEAPADPAEMLGGQGISDAAPNTNVFDVDAAEEKVDGLEMIGVTPGDVAPAPSGPTNNDAADAETPAKPDGISDLVDEAKTNETKKILDDYKAQENLDDEWRQINAREHFQKIMRSREKQGRSEMDPKYLDDIKGLKYYPESDSLKINIGFGKNIVDSPNGVQMATGFFTQESAEMVMAVTRTHDWAHERPIKLHGSKSQKNKLWLAAMHQGVKVDVAFQPSPKYLEMWKKDKLNPANQPKEQNPEDLYPGTSPGEENAAKTPADAGGPDQAAQEQAAKQPEESAPPVQEAAELAGNETGAPAQPVAEDVNPVQQDTTKPVMDTETANASAEELDEYKATVDARISATIDDLSARGDQQDKVQTLRETQEALQSGNFDVQTLERVDNAVFNQKFSVALSAVKPDSLAAPVKKADLGDSAPATPKMKSDGGMKL